MIVTAAQILADIGDSDIDDDLEDAADEGVVWLALHGYLRLRELPEPERRAVRHEKQRRRRAEQVHARRDTRIDIRPRKQVAA